MDKNEFQHFVSKDAVLTRNRDVVKKITLLGMILNIVLSGMKMAAGMVWYSQALVADGFHSLSDTITDLAVLFGVRFWTEPADRRHPHGHGRIETLVSLFIGLALVVVACILGVRAVWSIADKDNTRPGWLAFVVAAVSIVIKEFLYRVTVKKGRQIRSSALMANAWHHRSDAFSSIPVAISVLVCIIFPSLDFIDHIAAIVVSVILLKVAWDISYQAYQQLIDAGLDAKTADDLITLAMSVPDVKEVHKFRSRNIGPGIQIDLHVLVDGSLSVRKGHDIAVEVKKAFLDFNEDIVDVLVHIEPVDGT